MTNKIFLDTNVILDSVFNRKRFVDDAKSLLRLAKQRKLKIYISPVAVSSIYYIVKKNTSRTQAIKTLRQILPIVKVLYIGPSIVNKAMLSNFKDFEDALQNYCAEEANLTFIITRNIDDFSKSRLYIHTPKEYLAMIGE